MDLVHKVIANYKVEDRIALSEYIKEHKELFLEDEEKIYDMQELIRVMKQDAINDAFDQYDVVEGITGTIKIRDSLTLTDCCYKVEKEDD